MKILHTADIHLREKGDERWQALARVLEVGEVRGASVVAISGDLFDHETRVDDLKNPLRDLFETSKSNFVIIPGNHDGEAIRRGDFFGANVSLLTAPGQWVDIDDVRLFGLPFDREGGDKALNQILSMKGSLKQDGTNIVLFHGELVDMMFTSDGYGEGEESGYMPVKLSYFAGMGIDYVLAGHFHSNFDIHTFDGGYFVYPGSPVSHTRKETGPRSVNLFETGGPPSAVTLDTPYYEPVVVDLDPFGGVDPLEAIRGGMAAADPNARLLVTVGGLVDLGALGCTESEFADAVARLLPERAAPPAHEWRDITRVVDDELFARSMEKLESKDIEDKEKDGIRRLIIRSLMEASRAD